MSSVDLVASTVLGISASLLNDTGQQIYTNQAQLPYLKLALQELREIFELNSLPVVEETSAIIQVDAGVTSINFNAPGTPTQPKLPNDMVEPAQLWERTRGIDPFIPMTKREYLSHNLEGIQISQFITYVWQSNRIEFLPSNANNDIKIDYVKQLFNDIIDENTPINVINAATFLEFRVAGLCAEFIERNITSANSLNAQGLLALERATGISVKGKQNIMTRRRPFRAGYKKLGWMQ